MEIIEKVLTKSEINSRFIIAVDAVLANGLISNKGGLAESLKVKPAKFSEILNGRMNVGADMLAIMCNSYQVSPEWLLMSRGKRVFRTTPLPPTFIDDIDLDQVFQNNETEQPAAGNTDPATFMQLVDTIRQQAQEIGQLKERIAQLEREGGKDVSTVRSETVARVG